MRVALHLHVLGDAHAAGGAHPAEIVAPEVDEHEVLRGLLFAGAKLALHALVVLGGTPTPAGPGDGVVPDALTRDLDEHLR